MASLFLYGFYKSHFWLQGVKTYVWSRLYFLSKRCFKMRLELKKGSLPFTFKYAWDSILGCLLPSHRTFPIYTRHLFVLNVSRWSNQILFSGSSGRSPVLRLLFCSQGQNVAFLKYENRRLLLITEFYENIVSLGFLLN